jgi:hypothetical protein
MPPLSSPIVSPVHSDQEESPPSSPPIVSPVDPDQEEAEESLIQDSSYSEGTVRRHRRLFIESGDLFLQVRFAGRLLTAS